MKLIDLAHDFTGIRIDLAYSKPDNVAGRALYEPGFRAQLDEPAALALRAAASLLGRRPHPTAGRLQLVVWDAYRTVEAHQALLAIDPGNNGTYVAKVSNHCKGRAVDVTLNDADGRLLDMGTEHDDFSRKAHLDAPGLTAEQTANRQFLGALMTDAGFSTYPYEWWHFDYLPAGT